MDRCIYKGIDIFNPIDGKIKYFVDSFVKVYGEQYRTIIDKRLKNAKYFFLAGNFDKIIKKYKELENEELKKIDTTKNLSPSLKNLRKKDIKEKYGLITSVFEDSLNKLKAIDIKYDNATNKLLADRINLIRQLNKKPKLKDEEAKEKVSTFLDLLYLGENKLLKNKSLLSENKKQEYISLFNAMGYEGKDINAYLKNGDLLDDVYNMQIIRQLNFWNKSKVDEINKANFCVDELKYQLNNLQIYSNSNEIFEASSDYLKNRTDTSAFVLSCVTNNAEFLTLCFCKNALELTVEDITHEMGHIIDSFVVDSTNKGYFYKQGYEVHYQSLVYSAEKISPEYNPKSKEYRYPELFNEMLNEFICLKVAEEFKKLDKTIGFSQRHKNAKTFYQFGFEVFGDFLEKYQDKLIEFKLNVDKNEKAFEYFGENNFKKLMIMAKDYITARSQLHTRLVKGDKLALDEIEEIKNKTKQEFSELEKKIEKHIKTQDFDNKISQEKENKGENSLETQNKSKTRKRVRVFETARTFKILFNNKNKNDLDKDKSNTSVDNEREL